MSPKTDIQKFAKSATATGQAVKGFTDEERAAMKERARELKAEMRRGPRTKKSDGEKDVLAKIAEMPNRIPPWPNGSMPSSKSARQPSRRGPITGMSAYAKDGNVVCFFQSAHTFKARTRRSASATRRTSTKAACGRSPSP